MNKRILLRNIVFYCLSLIPYIALWYFLLGLIGYASWEGILSVITDAFGEIVSNSLIVFGFVAAASVIYLPFIFGKNKWWLSQVIGYTLTIIFAVGSYVIIILGDQKFDTFSPELWMEYPGRRTTMYTSFVEQYEPEGKEPEEIIKLLGQPDKVYENGVWYYDSTCRNGVVVSFEDRKVDSVWISD
ncbi:MAG: hypothetical protein DBX61_09540 [Clostridiales bacterium]|nr:MAG: hypothetical protein DBX61_09540 [Clostridiales bacterium]